MTMPLAVKFAHMLDPELAHDGAIWALSKGIVPCPPTFHSSRLKTNLGKLSLENPLGLAAGFDKNARAISALGKMGFGFIEAGAATPLAQPGNPKPRLFRLKDDRAIINRFGFNNDGAEAINERLSGHACDVPLGLNLGANKMSQDRSADFGKVLRICGDNITFATVNVSSPNTEKLRDLQGKAALQRLLEDVLTVREEINPDLPIYLKIAPDLTQEEVLEIADLAIGMRIDGVIATNTTLSRDGLSSRHRGQQGGLSGAPLFEKSTRVLAAIYRATNGQVPLIGVGGITSGQDAFDKITAGASAVQLYSALIYHGFELIPQILKELDRLLRDNGYNNIGEAVGACAKDWA